MANRKKPNARASKGAEMTGKPSFPPSPPFARSTQSDDLPYQVAEIAARLLVGDGYTDAAKRAIALIDACRNELNERLWHAIRIRALTSSIDSDEQAPKRAGEEYDPMPDLEAIQYITGQKRAERALPKFRDFWAYKLVSIRGEETDEAKRHAEEAVALIRKEGLSRRVARKYKTDFKAWWMKDKSDRASKAALARKPAAARKKKQLR